VGWGWADRGVGPDVLVGFARKEIRIWKRKIVRAAWAGKGGIFKGKETGCKVVWAKNKEWRNGLRIFFSNLIKGFEFKTKGLNFFKSILNWNQNRTESNRVLGTLQNWKSGIWINFKFKPKALNFFKSILNWTQNRTESNQVLGTLQNWKAGIWFKFQI
jgi:hypothetical protein